MQPSKVQLDAMDRLIDAMHLDKARDELHALNDGSINHGGSQWTGRLNEEIKSIGPWLDPSMRELPNPVLQRFKRRFSNVGSTR